MLKNTWRIMCSIGITNYRGLKDSNKFSQKRGPDNTNIENINGIEFLHNLLHLTGEYTIQPFIKNNKVAIFNGEIYNYLDFGDYKTDGEILIDLYEQEGEKFTKLLDGEFAICLIDFNKNLIIISTDTFACKPLWYEFIGDKFCIASYNSQLTQLGFHKGKKLYANKTKIYSLKTLKKINEFNNFNFDLNQYKTHFNDWIGAFEKSIHKRTRNTQYGIYLGLSSGYDSGAIACELLKQSVPFKSYTITGPENMSIINERIKLIPDYELIDFTRLEFNNTSDYLEKYCEDFIYKDCFINYNIKADKASKGLAAICTRANL
jgi:asparagine synthetase B (glutamine-hydrolysing)